MQILLYFCSVNQRLTIIVLLVGLLLFDSPLYAAEKQPTKGLLFFYKIGRKIDNFCLLGVDTAFIGLPEYSWRAALTCSEIGIHSQYVAENLPYWQNHNLGTIRMTTTTNLGADLGFQVGFRSFGFGYSWDVTNTYAQKLSFSFGGKAIGVEFSRQKCANTSGKLELLSYPNAKPITMPDKSTVITNTNLSVWYALNWAHYSHNAAIKQGFLQRHSAGSLLLQASYMACNIEFLDQKVSAVLADSVSNLITHQAAVGLGYGINFTPNHGKVILHAAATAKMVFYTINQVTLLTSDAEHRLGIPNYTIKPTKPISFSGVMRAAVSWEICPWVHLSAWGQADNINFSSQTGESRVHLSNWNWQAQIIVGVRFGAGRKRVNAALPPEPINDCPTPEKPVKLPKWIREYFFSGRE